MRVTISKAAILAAIASVLSAAPLQAATQTLQQLLGIGDDPAAIGTWDTNVVRDPAALQPVSPVAPALPPLVAPSNFNTSITTGSIGGTAKKLKFPSARLTGTPHAMKGLASYYHEDQKTANGERFDKRAMTAAHKTLPFGTRVRVTRTGPGTSNGKQVVVRINDRGPYKGGRIIDLSEAAAQKIGMTGAGIARVTLEVVGN